MSGTKHDAGKPALGLIAPELLFAIGTILEFGARKYAARNWEKGISWTRVFGALMRHLWAWWGGAGPTTKNFLFAEVDDETSHSHLWHAACCLMFLVAYEERGLTVFDDRAKADIAAKKDPLRGFGPSDVVDRALGDFYAERGL